MLSRTSSSINSLEDLTAPILNICHSAAEAILAVYCEGESAFGVEQKSDASPVTRADHASNKVIVSALTEQFPTIPIISEETGIADFSERQTWEEYWLVDPLDGTKEFIARNDQFTINIALIRKRKPVFGVVHLPVTGRAYIGINTEIEKRAVLVEPSGQVHTITARSLNSRLEGKLPIEVVASVHHHNPATQAVIEAVERSLGEVSAVNIGSALKFCLLAEGKADFYPRHALTSEWDTAAAQAVLEAAGGCVLDTHLVPLEYNTKESLLNPYFYAIADDINTWRQILSESI